MSTATTDPEVAAEPAPEPAADRPPKRTRAPRKRTRATSASTSTAKRAAPTPSVKRRLRELFSMAGGLVSLADAFDGRVILDNADELADSWAKVAERHPRLRQALEGFERGGVYGACAIATATVLLPILANHRLLPPQLARLGVAFVPTMPSAAPAAGAGPSAQAWAGAFPTSGAPEGDGPAAPLG